MFFKRKKMIETETKCESVTEKDNVADSDVKYIENPLPLPKKHVNKTMDFDIKVGKDDFDIQISEKDDFDV